MRRGDGGGRKGGWAKESVKTALHLCACCFGSGQKGSVGKMGYAWTGSNGLTTMV